MNPSGTATRQELRDQAADLGLAPGDRVMLHVSLRALGPVLGGPDLFIQALAEAVGPEGALLVYVGCEPPYDDIGRGCFTPEQEAFFRAELPAFDCRTARACRDFGAFAEIFRSHPGVRCSANPGARMAALGGAAAALTRDHPLDDGYGAGSPLERLVRSGGKVLLVGSDPDNVTLLHYAEAIAPIPGKRRVRIETALLVEGTRRWVAYEETDTANGVRDWPERFFARLVEAALHAGAGRCGRLGRARATLLDAGRLVESAVVAMGSPTGSLGG
jgi:aminoglycoside 3-N-acetyltransferase